MAIRKSNDRSNESDSKYNNIKLTHKAENITERFDDTTHNDNPYDDAIQYLSKKVDECVDEINLSDSSKVITSTQASRIIANHAKTGISTSQASAITANTNKTGITSTQASRITANHAKVGITTSQASAISANTSKTGITTSQASAISANTSKTGITSTQAGHITANNAKVGTTSTERSRIAANHAKVGTTSTERSRIAANHAKVGTEVDLTGNASAGITLKATIGNNRGAYSLKFTMTDSSGRETVQKSVVINLS